MEAREGTEEPCSASVEFDIDRQPRMAERGPAMIVRALKGFKGSFSIVPFIAQHEAEVKRLNDHAGVVLGNVLGILSIYVLAVSLFRNISLFIVCVENEALTSAGVDVEVGQSQSAELLDSCEKFGLQNRLGIIELDNPD